MTQAEQTRLIRLRLKLLQEAGRDFGGVARACRHFGISRKTFYKWKKRHYEHGDAGLCDQPRRPHRSPKATPPEIVSKILYLRQNYHFGPHKIAAYLKRFHRVSVSGTTVHRLLGKHGMSKLPANQKHLKHVKRWKRYEKAQPGHRLQMDVKFLERIPGTRKRLYQFTAIDDCTRIRVLKIYDSCTQKTAVNFADEVIQELDIKHVYIRPRTPRLNGKVERSHRVDNQEFYQLLDQRGIRDDIHLFNEKLREWEDYYNYHRPHGSLDGQTPYERLLAKSRAEVSPAS